MALSDDRLDDLSREMIKGNKSVNWLASKIEAEARKQDTELIQTMLEVFETLADKLPENKSTSKTCYAINDIDRDCVHSMVNLLRKRLENT